MQNWPKLNLVLEVLVSEWGSVWLELRGQQGCPKCLIFFYFKKKKAEGGAGRWAPTSLTLPVCLEVPGQRGRNGAAGHSAEERASRETRGAAQLWQLRGWEHPGASRGGQGDPNW